MTPTPARRKVFLLDGIVGLTLALLIIGSTIYIKIDNDRTQRAFENCVVEKFQALGNYLGPRGELNSREAKATKTVILAVAEATDAKTFEKALKDYRTATTTIETDREKTPLPEFPEGACND